MIEIRQLHRRILGVIMKISTISCGLLLLMWCLPAGAHARLQASSPADGSVITAPPSSIMLSFSKPVHLTAVWIEKVDEPRQNLRSQLTKLALQFSVPAPQLLPGRYEVGWRVFSDDGHVSAGKIQFTFLPGQAAGRSALRKATAVGSIHAFASTCKSLILLWC